MTTPLGWKCGDCGLVLAPHVNEHRCDPPSGGVAVRPVVAPYSPSTGVAAWPPGSGISVTPGITYSTGGGGGGGWQPPDGVSTVTVTATNAGAWRNGTLTLAPEEPRPVVDRDAA